MKPINNIFLLFFIGSITFCTRPVRLSDNHFDHASMLDFYTRQSVFTAPGRYEYLYDGLPKDKGELLRVVQGILISEGLAHYYGVDPEQGRYKAYHHRSVKKILELVLREDPSPISQERPAAKRMYGICSNFAILYCSMLRHQGIPARVRSGYATYFNEGKYVNHYICEYWEESEGRWVRVDTELIPGVWSRFNVLDMPPGNFITGGRAWQLARRDSLDPSLVGLGSVNEWDSFGWDMLRPGVYSDFITLNKIELHPWDVPRLWDNDHQLNVAYIDTIASMLLDDLYFETRLDLFINDDRFNLPRIR
jgi:hypothetical protein